MSRSYKKNPFVTDHKRKHSKIAKRMANKIFRQKIRQDDEMPKNPKHRKYTESWDICDYRLRMTKEEAIEYYYKKDRDAWFNRRFFKRFPTLDKWLKFWEKEYIRK